MTDESGKDRDMQDTATHKTTVTDHYIDVHHTYLSQPDDQGLRQKSKDVWFATKPASPEFSLVGPNEEELGDQATVATAWTISRAGHPGVYIFDRDDINGVRALLDELDKDFDRRDMEKLMASLDNEDEDE